MIIHQMKISILACQEKNSNKKSLWHCSESCVKKWGLHKVLDKWWEISDLVGSWDWSPTSFALHLPPTGFDVRQCKISLALHIAFAFALAENLTCTYFSPGVGTLQYLQCDKGTTIHFFAFAFESILHQLLTTRSFFHSCSIGGKILGTWEYANVQSSFPWENKGTFTIGKPAAGHRRPE